MRRRARRQSSAASKADSSASSRSPHATSAGSAAGAGQSSHAPSRRYVTVVGARARPARPNWAELGVRSDVGRVRRGEQAVELHVDARHLRAQVGRGSVDEPCARSAAVRGANASGLAKCVALVAAVL